LEIMVVGLGYVGSVMAAGLVKAGHKVTGVDNSIEQVKSLLDIHFQTHEPGLADLTKNMIATGRLHFCHIDNVQSIDHEIAIVCVGTPTRENGTADLSQVRNSVSWILSKTVRPITLVMRSTVPPGTGEKLTRQYFNKTPIRHNYIMNPEFLREGQAIQDWFHPDRIVIGGHNEEAIQQVSDLYKILKAPVIVTNITTAEMIKYASNAFLATKVSFINEIARLCEQVGADIDKVALGTGMDKRIGPSFLKAGLGYGGSCFPKDTRALHAFCTSKGINFELLQAVINVNNQQRLLAVIKIRDILGNLKGKTVAVLGLAFKPGTDDIREAPPLDIIKILCSEGAKIKVFDPVALKNAAKYLPSQVVLCHSSIEALEGANAVLLATEWDEFINMDWKSAKMVMKEPYGLVDGRNALSQEMLVAAGYKYTGIGRRLTIS
jgi:UDPglucose 6-dehydrogenase